MTRVLMTLCCLLLIFGPLSSLSAAENETRRTLALTGTGEVTAPPDLAIVTIGVTSQAKTAREALASNNRDMTAVITALKDAGLNANDIQTSNFSVRPLYAAKQSSNLQQPSNRQIAGYEVSNFVTAQIRDLDSVGAVLDKVVTVGSNRIQSLRYTISEPRALRDQARKKATEDALRKAKVYTEAARVELGEIIAIAEHGGSPAPLRAYERAAAPAAASVPVEAGSLTIRVRVNITWQIK